MIDIYIDDVKDVDFRKNHVAGGSNLMVRTA